MYKIFDIIIISGFMFNLVFTQKITDHDSVSLSIVISIYYLITAYFLFRNFDKLLSKLHWLGTDMCINETLLMFMFKTLATIAYVDLMVVCFKII